MHVLMRIINKNFSAFCFTPWNPAFYFGRNSRAYPVQIAVGSSKRSRAKEMKPRFGGAVIVAGVRVVVAACAAKHPHNAIIQKFLESGKKVMFHTKKRILSTTQQLKKKSRKRNEKLHQKAKLPLCCRGTLNCVCAHKKQETRLQLKQL